MCRMAPRLAMGETMDRGKSLAMIFFWSLLSLSPQAPLGRSIVPFTHLLTEPTPISFASAWAVDFQSSPRSTLICHLGLEDWGNVVIPVERFEVFFLTSDYPSFPSEYSRQFLL